MPTIQIADKPTLDNINSTTSSTATTVSTISTNIAMAKADTTVLKTRGGIKSDGTDLYGYNPTTSAWDKVSVGGGGGSTLVIKNENGSLTGQSITITHESGLFTRAITGTSDSYFRVEVPYTGRYMIAVSGGITVAVEVVGTGDTLVVGAIIIPSFANATWSEINTICNSYYNGNISDLSQYWSVGDTKTIHLDAMQAPNPNSGNTWAAQDITITILDFNHTDLATSINGHSKAALTLQTREVLNNNSSAYNQAGHIYVNGDSSYDTVFTKWSNLYMRTYMNDKVYNAFPSEIKSLIKSSKHYRHTNYNDSTSEIVTDNLFLPSYPEIFGAASYSYYTATSPVEGTQFKYYETSANRIKYGNNNGVSNGVAQYWWEGSASPYCGSSIGYAWCIVTISGNAHLYYGNGAYGLAPAFAI